MKYRIHTHNSIVTIKSRLSHNEQVNERELNYLSKNPITGLFGISYDGKKQLTYEAPLSVPIEKYLQNIRLEEKVFWRMMTQMVDMQLVVKNRGLYPEHLLIRQDMIFIREDTYEMFFVYQPVIRPGSTAGSLFAVIQDMIFQEIKKGSGIQQGYLIDFQNYLQLNGCNPEQIRQYIEQAAPWNEKKNPIQNQPGRRGGSQQQTGYVEPRGDSVDQHTVLLGSHRKNVPDLVQGIPQNVRLTRVNGEEQAVLSGEVLYLGRSSQNDYCIAGNISIGRRHAVIEKHRDGYYLKDMGSVNGTSVNGRRLTGEDICRLQNGDRIWLANEEFIFEFL